MTRGVMGAELAGLIADGNLLLAGAVAVLAGLVSFASPCVLPLVPGFLGYVSGMGAAAVPAGYTGAGGSSGSSGTPGSADPARTARVDARATAAAGRRADRDRPSARVGGFVRGAVPDVGAARDARDAAVRRRVLAGTALFVLGFTVVFVAGTVLASAAGAALAAHRELLMRGGGVVVLLLGLVFLGVGGGFGTQRTWQPRWRPAAGLAGAPLLGAVFAIGWSPCMGPTLAAIGALATSLSGDSGMIVRGGLLGVAYSIGLGLPFLLLAAGWSRAVTASAWLRRHHRAMQLTGGIMLIAVGLLLVSGLWAHLVASLQTSLVSSFTTIL